MFSLFSSVELSPSDAARLRRVEQKLDLILKHLGINADDLLASTLPEPVRALADQGRKIEAIKAHRDLNGSSLADVKEAVESYMARR